MRVFLIVCVMLFILSGCGQGGNAPPFDAQNTYEVDSPTLAEANDSLGEDLPEESPSQAASLEGLEAAPHTATPAWQEAYANYLDQEEYGEFYVGDINGDQIPELVIRYNETNNGKLFYFSNSTVEELELFVVSAWGKVGYLEETGQIIRLEWYGHTTGTFGSVDFYLYDWTPDGYTETLSVIRESGYDDGGGSPVYGQGYINGQAVEFDDFEATLADLYALLEQSTWFPMTDIHAVENYPDYFARWEQAGSPA